MDQAALLILGSGGMIGRALVATCKGSGATVLGGDRDSSSNEVFYQRIDLCEEPRVPRNVERVIFCSSPNYKLPEEILTRFLQGSKQFLFECARLDIPVVFLSTNHVFDGTGKPKISDKPHPICIYGQHKAQLEEIVLRNSINAVVRLTKVIGPSAPPFLDWCAALRSGKSIQAFRNFEIAPISVSHVTTVIQRIALEKQTGLFHLSARDRISFAGAIHYIAGKLGLNERLIEDIDGDPITFPRIGLDPSLDTTETNARLGLLPVSVTAALDQFVEAHLDGRGKDHHA